MDIKDSFEKEIKSGRTIIAIIIVAILWRTFISLDWIIAPWESACSGIALTIMGWVFFAYIHCMFKKQKGWSVSNWTYRGIAVGMLSINIYVVIYYAMRWYELLLFVEVYLPLDCIVRDIRYITLVMFYCAVIWSAMYLKKMHGDYMSLFKEKDRSIYTPVKTLKQLDNVTPISNIEEVGKYAECPYCGSNIRETFNELGGIVRCDKCGAFHHRECFEYYGLSFR